MCSVISWAARQTITCRRSISSAGTAHQQLLLLPLAPCQDQTIFSELLCRLGVQPVLPIIKQRFLQICCLTGYTNLHHGKSGTLFRKIPGRNAFFPVRLADLCKRLATCLVAVHHLSSKAIREEHFMMDAVDYTAQRVHSVVLEVQEPCQLQLQILPL